MTDLQDGGDQDRKVIRLFPDRVSVGLDRWSAVDLQDVDAVEREIRHVLREARMDGVSDRDPSAAPEPSHRNAVHCMQCDGLTWRHTRHCIHCGADLVGLAAERAERRREAWRGAFWLIAIASWALAPMCLYAAQHYALPLRVHHALNWTGGAIIAINAAVLWYSTLDRRR